MATNTSSNFSADVVSVIADEVLPLAARQIVAYQFGDPLRIPKGRGRTYTATQYQRVPLPFAPLSEGVPPIGQTMTISQVTATANQWGDKITLTDIAELTIFHPVFKQATELMSLQLTETLERNTFNALVGGTTQVNYVNSRGSRGSLVAGDVLDTTTIIRTDQALRTIGARRFNGDEMTDSKIPIENGGAGADKPPATNPHYVAIVHPAAAADFRQNSTVVLAQSYSELYHLYNSEMGWWSGIRFCESNMVPTWFGSATQSAGTAGTSGSLPGSPTNYYIIVTGSDTQNQYESYIMPVSNAISVTGPNGSISVTTPNVAGYTWNVYIGTTTSPTNLALSASGPTTGPLAGQATQLPGNTTVILTAVGLAQTPPTRPGDNLTVYPTFVFGRGSYGQVVLDDVKFSFLTDADKSDPLNQILVTGWKCLYGTIILQPSWMARIESVSAFNTTFG